MDYSKTFFELQPHHIDRGFISEAEIFRYGRIRASLHDLASLAHGEEAFYKRGVKGKRFEQRSEAFYLAVNRMWNLPCSFKDVKQFSLEDPKWQAVVDRIHSLHDVPGAVLLAVPQERTLNFETDTRSGLCSDSGLQDYGVYRRYVPSLARPMTFCTAEAGASDYRVLKTIQIYDWASIPSSGAIMAHYLRVADDQITAAINLKLYRLNTLLHEMQHGAQARLATMTPATEFSAELDADHKAACSLIGAGVEKDILPALLARRYMALLTSEDKSHMTALALEAVLERHEKMPSCHETWACSDAFKTEVVDALKKGTVCSENKAAGVFADGDAEQNNKKLIAMFQKKPRSVMLPFRLLTEKGAFAETPLFRHAAKRLVESARYFNPAWVDGPAETIRIRTALARDASL